MKYAIAFLVVFLVAETATASSRASDAQTEARAIALTVARFQLDVGRAPTEVEGMSALLSNPGSVAGWRGPYLPKLPSDPWGNLYRYRRGPDDGDGYVVYSIGIDGVDDFGDGDDITQWTDVPHDLELRRKERLIAGAFVFVFTVGLGAIAYFLFSCVRRVVRAAA